MGVLGVYDDRPISRAEARLALGLPDDGPVVLHFGAIREYKGLDTLLLAFPQVKKSIPNSRLLVAGKPWGDWKPYAEIIRAASLEPDVSLFLEYIPTNRVKEFFAAADLVVLPYKHFDAQSAVALTALAFGKPMIVSNVGGLGDLVRDPRCVVSPRDPESLAHSITWALSDPGAMKRLSADATRVAKEHSWKRIGQSTVAVYGELLAPHGGTRASLKMKGERGADHRPD
jgi:glycosyltransferase involved in cell wall biosynthesis